MQYLAIEDLIAIITQTTLDELTEQDAQVMDTAELMAMGEMEGYLSVRYDADACFDPLNKIPIITMNLADIALYHAHARIMPDNVPSLREERYKMAINWLEKIADGFINPALPIKDTEPTTPLRYGNSADKQDQYF